MSRYDVTLSLYEALLAHTEASFTTLNPTDVFDPEKTQATPGVRRGNIVGWAPKTVGFGNGAYRRVYSIFQINLWYEETAGGPASKTFREIELAAKRHVDAFYPSNRGQTLVVAGRPDVIITEKEPDIESLGREGNFLRYAVSVYFRVEY